MGYPEDTTSLRGNRTRQTCGFCLPVSQASAVSPVHGRDKSRGNTTPDLSGNTSRRRNAVVASRPPIHLGGHHSTKRYGIQP